MYTQVSIPKNGDGAGVPIPKNPTIIVIDVNDIVTEPTRKVGDVSMVGEYELKEGAKAIGVYATPSTIEITEENSGDPDARGFMVGVTFEHPGNTKEIKNFTERYANRGVVILTRECNGDARIEAHGDKCNPLFLTTTRTATKDANKRQFVFKQEMNSPYVSGDYTGTLPELAAEPAAEPDDEESV